MDVSKERSVCSIFEIVWVASYFARKKKEFCFYVFKKSSQRLKGFFKRYTKNYFTNFTIKPFYFGELLQNITELTICNNFAQFSFYKYDYIVNNTAYI